MSKRAKELADDFREWMVTRNAWPMAGDSEATARIAEMIDAELLKEREACADRFTTRIRAWEPASAIAMQIKGVLLVDGVGAILGDNNGL